MDPFFLQKPSSLDAIKGQNVQKIRDFFSSFKKGKALFIYGPPGTGKTASVYAYANEHDLEVLELNASDTRNKKELELFLSKATGQASLFGTSKLILIDEVDGLSGRKDRGAASAVAAAIASSPFPIVITGMDVFDKKLSPIKKKSQLLEFNALSTDVLVEILSPFNTSLSSQQLRSLARKSAGDARAALNDLFTLTILEGASLDDVESRKQTLPIDQALIPVFKSTDPAVVFGAFDTVNEDVDKIFLWIDQNIPYEYTSSSDLNTAYQTLSLADRFFGRIRRWQYYRFYVYCYALLSVGIALAKDKKYARPPRYKPPSRLLSYWRANMQFAKRKSIVEKLALKTKTSQKRALQDSFPFLVSSLANNKELQEELDLTSDEVSWLQKNFQQA